MIVISQIPFSLLLPCLGQQLAGETSLLNLAIEINYIYYIAGKVKKKNCEIAKGCPEYPVPVPCTCTLYLYHLPVPCTCTLYLFTVPVHCTCTLYLYHVSVPCTCTLYLYPVPVPCTIYMYPVPVCNIPKVQSMGP